MKIWEKKKDGKKQVNRTDHPVAGLDVTDEPEEEVDIEEKQGIG